MSDVPRRLVSAVLDWIACDECAGTGRMRDGARSGPCPHDHVVVTADVPSEHEGATGYRATVHADPARVKKWCVEHDSGYGALDERDCEDWLAWPSIPEANCRAGWRPVLPLNLTEVQA